MLLSDLLDAPHLGLRLRYADPGALERGVGRAVTTDLLEPGRYLTGGELVLSGLVWRRRPEDSETFVASVAGRGAAVLLAGRAQLGEVPDDLVDACRRHGLTLVEVPVEVSFADITEHIAAHDSAGRSRASASLVRQREMLSAIAAGRSLDELADRVSVETGHVCRVITPTGRHVVPGPGELAPDVLDVLSRTVLTADFLPAVVAHERATYSLFPVGSALGDRLTSWLLVAEGDHREWAREHIDAVGELCAIAALDRSRRDEGLRALRPIAGDALALAESGAPNPEVAGRLRQAGLDPARPLLVVAADLSGHGPEAAAALLEDVALAVGTPALGTDGHLAVALLPDSTGLGELVRRALGRLAPGLGRGRQLSVGTSSTTVDALAGALDEARFAHRVARAARSPVSIVDAEDVTSHVLLLAAVPDDVRRTYAHRVLGDVVEHDRRTDGDLLDTLSEFLACSCSWTRTAETMHLHVNTVRYRIGRVQELTGRDLSRLEDRVDIFLALRSL